MLSEHLPFAEDGKNILHLEPLHNGGLKTGEDTTDLLIFKFPAPVVWGGGRFWGSSTIANCVVNSHTTYNLE